MEKFLKRAFLFLLFVFLTDKVFYVFLDNNPKLEVDKRLEYLLEGKINKDILVFGSSRGAEDIIASQIANETKKTSYNLSYPGSDIEFHYFILETALRFNSKPKMVVLAIDNPMEIIYAPSLNFRYDRLYPLSKYNYVNDKLIEKGERTVLSHFLMLARMSKESFSYTMKETSRNNPIMDCGSMPFLSLKSTSNFTFQDSLENYDIRNESSSKLEFFKQFQKRCIDNKIRLILCFPPNFRTYNSQLQNRLRTISLPETEFFIYDTLNPIYKNSDYFYDESHLNIKGAKIFTKELSNYINLEKITSRHNKGSSND